MTFVADAFRPLAEYESEALGLEGLPLAIIEYPIGGVPEEVAAERAKGAFGSIVAGLTAGQVRS